MKGWAESRWWVCTASKANTSLSVGEHFMHALYYKAHWKLEAAFLKELLCNSDIWGFQFELVMEPIEPRRPHFSCLQTFPLLQQPIFASSGLGLKAQAWLCEMSHTVDCSMKQPLFETSHFEEPSRTRSVFLRSLMRCYSFGSAQTSCSDYKNDLWFHMYV